MSSSREFVQYVLDQLSGLDQISHRAMMGEYVLYYQGKVIGGIYNDRLMVKAVPSAIRCFEEPVLESPYAGAREMLLVEKLEDRQFLDHLFNAMIDEIPTTKKRKKHTRKADSEKN